MLLRVRLGQAVGDLARELDGAQRARQAVAQHAIERLALDQLHDDPVALVGLDDVVDVDDRRMVEARRHPRLAAEAQLAGGVGGVRQQPLDGQRPLQGLIEGAVDRAHAARAEALFDQVVADAIGNAQSIVRPRLHGAQVTQERGRLAAVGLSGQMAGCTRLASLVAALRRRRRRVARAAASTPTATCASCPSRARRSATARTLRVLLPPGYDAPENRDRRYPVLYLNDGQNLFDAATSTFTGREWRVDETVRELTAAGRIPPIVVVGIDHAGRRERFHEYFPWVDAFLDPPDPDPHGARYPAFLVDEVIPFVEARYRVDRDPEQRGVGGSSAGGLAAINAVISRPACSDACSSRARRSMSTTRTS